MRSVVSLTSTLPVKWVDSFQWPDTPCGSNALPSMSACPPARPRSPSLPVASRRSPIFSGITSSLHLDIQPVFAQHLSHRRPSKHRGCCEITEISFGLSCLHPSITNCSFPVKFIK